MGGRSVRAIHSGLRFSLPLAANCRGLTMLVSAAPAVQGTTVATEGPDLIQAIKDGASTEPVVAAGGLIRLKSDGTSWVEQ